MFTVKKEKSKERNLLRVQMLDFRWLLGACPDLRKAGRLLVLHGEGARRCEGVQQGPETAVHLYIFCLWQGGEQ